MGGDGALSVDGEGDKAHLAEQAPGGLVVAQNIWAPRSLMRAVGLVTLGMMRMLKFLNCFSCVW